MRTRAGPHGLAAARLGAAARARLGAAAGRRAAQARACQDAALTGLEEGEAGAAVGRRAAQAGACQGAAPTGLDGEEAAACQGATPTGLDGEEAGAARGVGDPQPGATPNAVQTSVHPEWLEAGMDPNTSYLLKIKLVGNRKTARQDVKCFSFDMVVDSDLINLKYFVESVVENYHADSTPEASNSQSLEISSKKKGRNNSSNSGASKRSRSGSNQPEALSIDYPSQIDQPMKGKAAKKKKPTKKKELQQQVVQIQKIPPDSPSMSSMCTRSKKWQPASPAMSTRSKRRLSL